MESYQIQAVDADTGKVLYGVMPLDTRDEARHALDRVYGVIEKWHPLAHSEVSNVLTINGQRIQLIVKKLEG